MKRIAAKLAFIHRRLWQRDGTYRAAILLGPPPLLGCALAAAAWMGVHAFDHPSAMAVSLPSWARPTRPDTPGNAGQPRAERPGAPLPAVDEDGKLGGLETRWRGVIQPIEISPTLDVTVLQSPLAMFTLDQTGIDMARIMAAGPPGGLFAGVQTAVFAARVIGAYEISARLERTSQESADCLVRFNFADRRLFSNISLNMNGNAAQSYEPVSFELQPGLYRVSVVFGCWRGRQVIGPGQLTVLVRHPGELAPRPARPDDILRPVSRTP